MINFQQLVKEELTEARIDHGPQSSYHEGYAVLLEEVDELWDIVKAKSSKRSHQHALLELVQIASCAQKMAEDIVIPSIIPKRNKNNSKRVKRK
jgi:hypothetical protein